MFALITSERTKSIQKMGVLGMGYQFFCDTTKKPPRTVY